MQPNKKFIGFIGFGYWGKNILRNLYEMEVLHTACDSDLKIVSEHKNKFLNIYNFTTSFEEVLDNSDIKAVAIATPAATHYQLVKQSLLSKKDVFVEKPLALKEDKTPPFQAISTEKKVWSIIMIFTVMVMQVRR